MVSDSDKPASRVAVMDAIALDREIQGILKDQMSIVTNYLPSGLLARYQIELDTLLRIIVWKLSVAKLSATFGQQILKLKYDHQGSANKLHMLGLLTIGSYYLKERKNSILKMIKISSIIPVAQIAFDWGEAAINIFNMATFISFLRNGNAPTWLERILGLKPVSSVTASSRNVGYSYMTRELLWHGFIELLLFVIPLINYYSLKRRLSYLLPVKFRLERKDLKGFNYTIGVTCALCNTVPVLPHCMGCPHAFCYYCLASSRAADKDFECPRCGFSDSSADAMIPVQVYQQL